MCGAPRLAVLGTQPPPDLGELALDRRPALRHLLVRQRAVRRAELEPQRKRLLAESHLLAAVEVEHPDGPEQVAAARPDLLDYPRRRHVLGDHHRDVLQYGREAGHVAIRRGAPGGELHYRVDV